MKETSYQDQINKENATRLRELLNDLPRFAQIYFRGIEPTTSSRTRIAYAYDLKIFFRFLKENNPALKNTEVHDFKVDLLDSVKAVDIEEYLDYLKFYKKENKEYINELTGIKRKLITLRSFYNYYFKKEMISTNPTQLVDIPKLHEKEIIRLDVDEVARLLDEVESGEKLTARQQKYHAITKTRDLAILTLLLGTGIRVSECVGLDIDDVDFVNGGIKITRKGGNQVIIYFGDEVDEALYTYMEEREKMVACEGHNNALFLSMQKKRMSVRSIELLVKKYSVLVTKLKHITPHKLRSTYGTNLYAETGDIYLVADVLGHKDVNTTRKHYAAIEDSRRRSAANVVKLREKYTPTEIE